MMSLQQVSQAVGGQLIGSPDLIIHGVCTDTRKECADQLFIALKGDNFDAHNFVHEAIAQGANSALLEKPTDKALPSIIVEDARKSFGDLAAWWRQQFVLPVVGVTGSVGKTTTKEMLGCIFSELGQGVVTQGNLNNEIGVPMTLMRLSGQDLFAIIEMGMNHAGEIERLSEIAKPTIALITKAAEAHLEGLGSVEGVAKAKAEIFTGLSDDGVAIINADDPFASYWKRVATGYKQLTFGLHNSADISANYNATQQGITLQVKAINENFAVSMNTIGEHNIENALAAITVAIAANIPSETIVKGLRKYRPYKGRLNVYHLPELILIDDTYNANPASMRAAIDVLANYPQSTLIVGDMAELGDVSDDAHRQVGEYAQSKDIKIILSCGAYANKVTERFSGLSHAFDTQAELLTYLATQKFVGACLVKGSRGAAMENVIEFIKTQENSVGVGAC